MQVKITNVSVETVQKGRSNYQVATVSYQQDGQDKEKKIMSFANPTVFAVVQNFVGQEVNIKAVKNGQYWEWANIEPLNGSGNSAPARQASSNTFTSDRETKEERAQRQVLIVKQSSFSSAVEALGPGKEFEEYKDFAQKTTDWVFE